MNLTIKKILNYRFSLESLRFSKVILFFSIILPSMIVAQDSGRFTMGFIGNQGGSEIVYSSPVVIPGSNCIDVEAGLRFLLKRGNGDFSIGCIEKQNQNIVELTSYPNPAVDFTIVKPLTTIPQIASNEYFIQVSDYRGKVYEQLKTDFVGLTNGIRLSLSNLTRGYYLVTITSKSQVFQTLKIIKN